MTFLGTFAEHIVCPADSLLKFPADMNPAAAAIVGCAIPTGFGTAVNVADVQVGDVVVVVGTGGVGMAAVQGARVAGARTIVTVDPVQWKRERAALFGATQTAGSIDEALGLVADLTEGVMADRAIMTVGVMDGALIEPALRLISKGGVLAIASVSPMAQTAASLPIFDFVSYQKQIRGSLYGGWSPRTAIPMLLELYRSGDLLLDELVTRTYPLEEINRAYTDMHEGRNLRGVILYG
jgi:S-(hydroxymethyl)glutathione dehydrogenase/alcohol dehydrogenase